MGQEVNKIQIGSSMDYRIVVVVSDEELRVMKASVEKRYGQVMVDPLKFLQYVLQKDVDMADTYVDYVFDGGGYSLGDILTEGQIIECFGIR
jgi:hypothetical protein